MKRTLHFSSVPSREEQRFDFTKGQDIRRSNGDTSRLPESTRLDYDLNLSYAYLEKHAPCATNFDLYRSERFADDAKSVKKKQEEWEEENRKLILNPKYDVVSNKGPSFPSISFPKAKRQIATVTNHATLRSTSAYQDDYRSGGGVSPIVQNDLNEEDLEDDLASMTPQEKEAFHRQQVKAQSKKEAAGRALKNQEKWKEMHSHIPGDYSMKKVHGRDGYSLQGKKNHLKEERRLQKNIERAKSVPLPFGFQKVDRMKLNEDDGSPSQGTQRKTTDVDTYQRRLVMESERESDNVKAHLFRSDIGRERPPIGQARGLEAHDYPVELDTEKAQRMLLDTQAQGPSFTTARRIMDEPPKKTKAQAQLAKENLAFRLEQNIEELRELQEKKIRTGVTHARILPELSNGRVAQGKDGKPQPNGSKLASFLPSLTNESTKKQSVASSAAAKIPVLGERSKIFDSLLEKDGAQSPPLSKVAQLKTKAQRFKPKAHAKAKTGFHLEDFLNGPKFQKKLREYEEELVRHNLAAWEQEDIEAGLISPRGPKAKDTTPRAEEGDARNFKPGVEKPRRKTVADEEKRQNRLIHLANLTGLSISHDDCRVQYKGVLPEKKRMVVDVGSLCSRSDDVQAQASYVSPVVRDMIQLGRRNAKRQKELDAEYKRSLIEYENANMGIMPVRGAADGQHALSPTATPRRFAEEPSHVSMRPPATLSEFLPSGVQ